MNYSVVIPSRDKASVEKCVEYWSERSIHCNEIIVLWNGPKENSPKDPHLSVPVWVIQCQGMDVYAMYNYGTLAAKNEYVLLTNDDMLPEHAFDDALPQEFRQNTVITFQLVESGYVAVNHRNIFQDLGSDYDNFDSSGFDKFCEQYAHDVPDLFSPGQGWYMPVVFPQNLFRRLGMYPTDQPFPHPNDVAFFNTLDKAKINFVKAESLIYHFQRLSQRNQNAKPSAFGVPDYGPSKRIQDGGYNKEKLGLKKMNLCCGDDKKDDYLNVDIIDSDYDVDLSHGLLPFPNEHFDEILWKHGIEHFRLERAVEILNDLKRLLSKDGFIYISSPELSLSCSDYLEGSNRFGNCAPSINRIYGLNINDEQVHKYGYTAILDRDNNIFRILEHIGLEGYLLTPTHRDEWVIKARKKSYV